MTNKHTIHDCCCDNTDLNSLSPKMKNTVGFSKVMQLDQGRNPVMLLLFVLCVNSLQLPNAVSQAA